MLSLTFRVRYIRIEIDASGLRRLLNLLSGRFEATQEGPVYRNSSVSCVEHIMRMRFVD